MDIYNVNKYHPAWMWYIESEDLEYISQGRRPTPEERKDLKKRTVDSYMRENDLTAEQVEATFKERTASKQVHRLYGTD